MLTDILYNFFLLPTLFSLFLLNPVKNSSYQSVKVLIDGKEFNVYVADSFYKRSKGLMFAKKLKKDEGMLFSFNNLSMPTFYNKNVKMPLGFLWIDSNYKVVDYSELPKNTFKTTQSSVPIKYVIEINQNIFDKSIVGSSVIIGN